MYMELDQFLKLRLKVFEFEFCAKIETSWLKIWITRIKPTVEEPHKNINAKIKIENSL